MAAALRNNLPPVGSAGRRHVGAEYSAGGVVTRDGKVLLVKVENLKGEEVWTFPKGHLDPGESPRQAALREVLEETGYACAVVAPLTLVRYMFRREGRLVRKRVRWYRMEPVKKAGVPDATEVRAVRWMGPIEAGAKLRYPGDKRLLTLMQERLEAHGR